MDILIARICIALFALSTAFPILAAILNRGSPSRLLGLADVVVAALLVGAAVAVATRARTSVLDRHRLAAFRVTQIVIAVIPLSLAAFFLTGQRVDWTVLVIGLAWRGWLLLYTLPFLAAALEPASRNRAIPLS